MPPSQTLLGFAYGEQTDPLTGRSLGYRLLAPAAPEPWCAEVEALAQQLQAVAYPEAWPPVELFCSVLLSDGRRVVAAARYGRQDHTASKRRGGVELVGVVGPRDLAPDRALAVYRWLRQRRAGTEDLAALGGTFDLSGVLDSAPPPDKTDPAPTLPVRPWQDGALLFSANSPGAPDRALGVLGQSPPETWQWLPLCGGDFPVHAYAARGPLVGWAPHTVEVAVRVGPPVSAPAAMPSRHYGKLAAALAGLLVLLLGANLWAVLALPSRIPTPAAASTERKADTPPAPAKPAASADESAEKLALALHALLREEGGAELQEAEADLLARYRKVAARHPDLRVDDRKAQAALGLIALLAKRSPDRVARLIEEEFTERKGYDQALIRLVSGRVRARLVAEAKKEQP